MKGEKLEVKRGSGNVFRDLGHRNADAEQFKAILAAEIIKALDREGIAVRAGHHCAEPLMHRFGLESTARASFGIYTTHEEIDFLADALTRVREFFA